MFKKKKKEENINNSEETNYVKIITFFGGYLLLFVLIFFVFGFSFDIEIPKSNYEMGTSKYFYDFSGSNYHFIYTVNVDDNTYRYEGDRYINYLSFKYNEKNYFYDGNNFYVENDSWEKCDNPFKFYKFFDSKNIISLINESYFEYNSSYTDGKIIYNLLLSSNTINKIINNKDTDIDEIPNNVNIVVTNKALLDEATFELNNYCKVIDDCNSKLNIKIEYGSYNEVETITNPINS